MRMLAAVTCFAVLVGPLDGQTPVTVSGPTTCPSCRIELTLVATLGGGDGPGFLASDPRGVARDSRGRFYVVQDDGDDLPQVYAPDGTFLYALGRLGSGPGEYRDPDQVFIGPNDSVYVMDTGLGRLTVLTAAYEFARSANLPGTWFAALRLADDTLILSGSLPTLNRAGYPLHRIAATDRVAESFGTAVPIYRESRPWDARRALALSGDTAFWAVPLKAYRLELWNRHLKRVTILERDVSWFQPYDHYPGFSRDRAPDPRLLEVHEDRAGRIWTAVVVPATDWVHALEEVQVEGELSRAYRVNLTKAFDARLEVLDRHGTLIASGAGPAYVLAFLTDSLLADRYRTEDGVPLARIWRYRLVEP